MVTAESNAVQSDRLGFFLFLALSLHLMIILGVGFAAEQDNSATPQLEVTLAQYQSRQAPEDAKFIAQSNQEGSGTLSEQAEITTRRLADFSDNRIRKISAAPELSKPQTREEQVLASVSEALDEVFKQEEELEPEPLLAAGVDPMLSELSDSIASLEARLDEQQQAYAERPRVRRLTSLSAKQAIDAAYLHSWRTRVEAIGNRYYPTA
jgi:protein TonB